MRQNNFPDPCKKKRDKIKRNIFILLLSIWCQIIFSACSGWNSLFVGTLSNASLRYHSSLRIEKVYRSTLKNTYFAAIRVLKNLNFEITKIDVGEARRLICARNPDSGNTVTMNIEKMGPSPYVKVTLKCAKYSVIPNRPYGLAILEEFQKEISKSKGRLG